MDLDDPTAVALLAAEALRAAGIEHALYGGLVLAAHGAARETRDADLAVAGAATSDAARSLEASGARDDRLRAHRVRRPLGQPHHPRRRADPTGPNTLDLVEPRSRPDAERALVRALRSTLRARPIRLLTPEDFVVFEVLSTRELDVEDARSVLASLGQDVDRALVESELAVLARELPEHAVGERGARVLRS